MRSRRPREPPWPSNYPGTVRRTAQARRSNHRSRIGRRAKGGRRHSWSPEWTIASAKPPAGVWTERAAIRLMVTWLGLGRWPGNRRGRMPAIRDGDHILVIDRKLFNDDNTRFFVGTVEEYDEGIVRLRGFPFHLSPYEVTGVERHGEERVRVVGV